MATTRIMPLHVGKQRNFLLNKRDERHKNVPFIFFSYFITLSSQLWTKLLTIEKEKKGVLNDGQSVQLLQTRFR